MQGIILYRGPSVLDGAEIVVIATGLRDGGHNSKTGPMVQVYILRSDVNPLQAVQTGADASICGTCRHRGKIVRSEQTGLLMNVERSCYVTLMHGPRVVFDAYERGKYENVPPARARELLADMRVRLGAYGDPAAVPFEVWEEVLADVREITGYTHQWRQYPRLSDFCMASCDTPEEREEAQALGFRTFRVRSKDDPVLKGEGICPASKEMGHATQCAQCLLCGGKRSGAKADIAIIVHGTGAVHFANEFA